MMNRFVFKTDDEYFSYCEDILQEMILLFKISEEEALSRMNRYWKHLEFIGGEEELLGHELPGYWAKNIYYGDAHWWTNPLNLKPVPYP